ncbi:PREDICTED: probable serine/threonine-protein kinase PLK [Papilio xuthus]|uniref:Probable serine/threonine-protein kinase PLK n=1 Tax=Papilio xuthus TaxID=66420 RepID=A0AAJ6ZSH5_PAPXU|nr:PREDICTED: probable serine/threonine-protein kinase PLK [Papilio xuthus]
MWLRVLIVFCVTTRTWSQYTYANQKVQQGGTQFEWGWQLTPVNAQLPIDHFLVQTGPQIQYADIGGLQNTGPLVDATGLNYNTIPYQIYQNPENQNHTQIIQDVSSQAPLDIFLLHQFPVTSQTQEHVADNSIQYTNEPTNSYTQTGYNIQTDHTTQNNLTNNHNTAYKENDNQNNAIITPIVQVFKDHNCANDDINKEQSILEDKTTYENINENFETKEPLFKGAANFKIETRSNTNNEGYYYYSTEISPKRNYNEDQEGISKLVASTQDLISNDDLITINHSAEKQVYDLDEYIQPYNSKTVESRNSQNQITLKAKIRNIENTAVPNSNAIRQNNYENKFTSPIVVQDSKEDDYKEEILDTLVSTMTPFIQNGYVIASIKKNASKNAHLPHYFNEETVYVTPRPIGQKYLAPITVALRLLNSNNTDIINTIEDHEASDSEFVEDKVKIPTKGRTIVEIQESIPLDITHINEIEVHQYLEEGRSNSPINEENVYNAFGNQRNDEQNIQDVSHEYGKKNIETYSEHNSGNKIKRNEELESNESIKNQITFEYNDYKGNQQNNTNNENIFGKRNNRKVIQPIIVEKEIPVLQYRDRYIEKQIPNSEKTNHVPDRPVLIPVPYEKIVEKPIEVTKYVDKPYPVQVPQPYPVPIKVPYPVEQQVYVDRPVHVPYPVEKVVEKEVIRNVPVPTPVAVPVKVQVPVEKTVIVPIPVERPYPVPVEKPVEKIVEKEIRVPYPVEKKVLYPVPYEKTVHVPVEKIIEKPVHINVPVPIPVHIIKHYPVDRIVEKKVPYPVEKVVEKFVEKPKIVTKYIDRPYAIENPYNVEKRTENNMPFLFQTYSVDNSKAEDSQNLPQYLQNESQNVKQNRPEKTYYNQLQEYIKDNQEQFTYTVPIQTTQWGSLYASTYKYTNIKPNQAKNNQIYNKYLTNNQNLYYGPPPLQKYNNYWENNSYSSVKSNRFQRQQKVTNLRIEYGFKPPLIPSIEIDLHGRPINKETDK